MGTKCEECGHKEDHWGFCVDGAWERGHNQALEAAAVALEQSNPNAGDYYYDGWLSTEEAASFVRSLKVLYGP